MKNKIAALIVFMALSIWFLSIQCYGMGWFLSKPSHNIILMGVVNCIEDGVVRPEPGATVVIKRIYDAANIQDYELPAPEITTTDGNGMWIITFSMAFDNPNVVTLPGKYEGEIISRCKKSRIPISGWLEPVENFSGILTFLQGRAGSLADLVKQMASKMLKIKFPTTVISTKLSAYADFNHTDVECSKKPPAVENPAEPENPLGPSVDISSGPQQPVTPTPATPGNPTSTGDFVPPIPQAMTDVSQGSGVPPDAYAKCVAKCNPIYDKLEPLRKRLKELEESESDEGKRLKKEISRLKSVYDATIKSHQVQRYIAPDGKEHVGQVDLEQSYKKNGYRPVSGTQQLQIHPDIQKFLNSTRQKIARTEAKLNNALAADEKRKQPERERIEREMDKIKLEYYNCVRSCDRVKTVKDRFMWDQAMIDFISRTGSKTDTSEGFQAPPQKSDTSTGGQAASVPPDAAVGEGPMPIGPAQPLVDSNAGFDKEPPVNTRNYETTYQALGSEAVQYKNLDLGKVAVDVGVHYQDVQDGGMNIDTTALATGEKGHLREWEVTDTALDVDGVKIRPHKKDKFYVAKESAFRKTATAVFFWLGSQYRDRAGDAQSGEVCPVTGKPKAGTDKKGPTAEAIDRAGMAAGLGLLVSQAKGEITGQKCYFSISKEQAQKVKEGKGALKVGMENRETGRREKAEIPIGEISY